MKQFDLNKYLKNTNRKVVTRAGEPVEIVLTDWDWLFPVLGRIHQIGDPKIWLSDGRVTMGNEVHDDDLFFADEEDGNDVIEEMKSSVTTPDAPYSQEKPISSHFEMPFGVNIPEATCEQIIIPDDCEARIEGNKVIIKRKEPELTEFEAAVRCYCTNLQNGVDKIGDIKKIAKNLLEAARKQLEPEFEEELEKAYQNADKVQWKRGYEKGKQDAIDEVPVLRTVSSKKECYYVDVAGNRVRLGVYECKLDELMEKLPKEEK